ncbi:MAG: ABC transporter permease [Candidatus Aminicenantes bacterium]|nr:ABC transporter permease [Candidatus Aminicenantes bacterium]
MIFLKLGFRSLFRQKRRTAVSLLVLTFGIGCLLLVDSHSRYIEWGLRESTIHSETGHIQVFHRDFFVREESRVLEFGLDDVEALRNDLLRLEDVALVQARVDFMGLVSNGEKSVACLGQAVEPALEKRMRGLFRMSAATYDALAARGDDVHVIALGRGLARSLGVQAGDSVTFMSTTAEGALNAMDLEVAATFTGAAAEYDERAAVVPLATARLLLDSAKVKHLLVTLTSTSRTDAVYEAIGRLARDKGYPVALKKWHERAQYYRQVQGFYEQVTGFLSVVLFLIIFFSTSNTILMAVVERTPEIGTLLALGTSRRQTLLTFLSEGLFIGLIGGVLSALVAFLATRGLNALAIVLPPPPGLTDGYPLSFRMSAGGTALIVLGAVLAAAAASVLPTLRAARMRIVDALGHI